MGVRSTYASAETGDLEIYRLDLASQEKTRLTDARGLDLRPAAARQRVGRDRLEARDRR